MKAPKRVISLTSLNGQMGLAVFDLFDINGQPYVKITNTDGSLFPVQLDPSKLKSLQNSTQADFAYEGLILLNPPQRN